MGFVRSLPRRRLLPYCDILAAEYRLLEALLEVLCSCISVFQHYFIRSAFEVAVPKINIVFLMLSALLLCLFVLIVTTFPEGRVMVR